MNTCPLITIGIASYNYGRFLVRAFEAIKRQQFEDFEILYCDDGSTDNSIDIIENFIHENPQMRIRLIKGSNVGVMGNKNRIIDNAEGKYLMFCDADDWMEDNCLSVLAKAAIESDADQIAAAFKNVTDDKILQIQEIPSKQSKWTWGIHHATLYKMDVIKKNNLRFEISAYPDDVYFNMVFHEKCRKVKFINEIVYNWYMHKESTSSRENVDDFWHGKGLLDSALRYIIPIYDNASIDEKEEIEYMACKIYGLAIFYRNTGIPFNMFYKEYMEIKKIMDNSFPNYKDNTFCQKMDGKSILRKRTAFIIYGTVLSEKIGLQKVMLLLYWLISKIHTFSI